MYKKHPCFEEPKDQKIKVWRYMDFYKFVSILEYNSLFFPNIKCLEKFDKMEGFLPQNAINSLSNFTEPTSKCIPNGQKGTRKMLFVNCWHINETESDAMWKIYLTINKGIAIQTTLERLKNSFASFEKDIYIGMVQYTHINDIKNIQLLKAPFDAFKVVLQKRKNFEHERELRAVLLSPTTNEAGVKVKVDLDKLIENIYAAPNSESWIKELIEKILNRYQLKKEVKQSLLDNVPNY